MADNFKGVDKFDDNSKLWFGKHVGKELANVPASYLLWWYNENSESATGRPLYGVSARLEEYIDDNMDVLTKQSND